MSVGLILCGLGLVLAPAFGVAGGPSVLASLLLLGGQLVLWGCLGVYFAVPWRRADEAPLGPVLARWRYDAATWAALVRTERAEAGTRVMAGVALAALAAIAGLWGLLGNEHRLPFAATMWGCAVFFAVMGFGTAADRRRQVSAARPEAVITHAGVSFLGRVIHFNGVTAILDAVALHPDDPDVLVFCFRRLSGRPLILRPETLEVPVPHAARGDARDVVRAFGTPLTATMKAVVSNDASRRRSRAR